jgi:hypothetical protein
MQDAEIEPVVVGQMPPLPMKEGSREPSSAHLAKTLETVV